MICYTCISCRCNKLDDVCYAFCVGIQKSKMECWRRSFATKVAGLSRTQSRQTHQSMSVTVEGTKPELQCSSNEASQESFIWSFKGDLIMLSKNTRHRELPLVLVRTTSSITLQKQVLHLYRRYHTVVVVVHKQKEEHWSWLHCENC